jgi:16S rRNA processing protein RimM
VRLVVGRVVRPHGIRGEVVVDPATDRPAERFRPGAVLAAPSGPLTVREARPHSGRWLLSVEGVVDRTGAEALRGAELAVDVADDDSGAEPDAWYDAQLVGLAVHDETGVIGSVAAVEHGRAQDLLVLDLDARGRVRLPFVAALVPEVDAAGGWLRVALPPGLLDLAER